MNCDVDFQYCHASWDMRNRKISLSVEMHILIIEEKLNGNLNSSLKLLIVRILEDVLTAPLLKISIRTQCVYACIL